MKIDSDDVLITSIVIGASAGNYWDSASLGWLVFGSMFTFQMWCVYLVEAFKDSPNKESTTASSENTTEPQNTINLKK